MTSMPHPEPRPDVPRIWFASMASIILTSSIGVTIWCVRFRRRHHRPCPPGDVGTASHASSTSSLVNPVAVRTKPILDTSSLSRSELQALIKRRTTLGTPTKPRKEQLLFEPAAENIGFAFKALGYATLLCLGTFTSGVLLVKRCLGVKDVEEFSTVMRKAVPQMMVGVRRGIEGVVPKVGVPSGDTEKGEEVVRWWESWLNGGEENGGGKNEGE